MIYKVRARFLEDRAGEFFRKLTDGTIAGQQPDGREIVASMKRARMTSAGMIEWFETCYCESPLKHERETIYDFYLSDIETEPVETKGELTGDSFWDYLSRIAG